MAKGGGVKQVYAFDASIDQAGCLASSRSPSCFGSHLHTEAAAYETHSRGYHPIDASQVSDSPHSPFLSDVEQ